MDMKLGISILLNVTPQKLVMAPGAIFRGNTVPWITIPARFYLATWSCLLSVGNALSTAYLFSFV